MIDQIIIMQTEWSNLVSPNTLGEGLASFIGIMLSIIPYTGMRLRSPAVFITWMGTVIVLVLTILTALPFIWFWLMILLNVFVIGVSAIVFYLME